MIPFFVADRPMSLRILKTSGVDKRDIIFGLMSHANTSENFQHLMSIYPCEPGNCMLNKNCGYPKEICKKGQRIRERTIRMCDSGVFTKEGCMFTYRDLFRRYEMMNVDYGIIIDILKDKKGTIKSAKKAIKAYQKKEYPFKLIGVAQGNTEEEYIECYEELLNIGYKHIAIGGLLKKRENSARYTTVKDEDMLKGVLRTIREKYPGSWLYALGCYHPKRHDFFEKISIFGSDSKGWIFNYEKDESHTEVEAREHRFKQVHQYLQKNIYKRLKPKRSSRALIVSCSKNKKMTDKPISAMDRYNGPYYRILREYMSNGGSNHNLDILIVSAKYGLIKSSSKIEHYDQIMTEKRAREINNQIVESLNEYFLANRYSEVFINLGKPYRSAVEGFKLPYNETEIIYAEGRIGERLSSMKEWLYQKV